MSGASVFSPITGSPKEHSEPDIVRTRSSSPNEKMLSWIQTWPKSTITKRDIQAYGPNCLRDPAGIPALAQTLVECGWILPARAHRRDMKKWRIVREPTVRV
jgi:hypothetical protein